MKKIKNLYLHPAVTVAVLLMLAASQTPAQSANPKEASMSHHATGPFDLKVTPQDDKSDDPLLGRMTLDKQYHGDLDATGKGQMLTAGSAVKGSGAYVAIEKVTGSLQGAPVPSSCSTPEP